MDGQDGFLKVWSYEPHPDNQYTQWYLDHLGIARERLQGLSDDNVLRWILAFTHQEIEALSEEAKRSLSFDLVALMLRQFIASSPGIPVPVPDMMLTTPQLIEIQYQTTEGLQKLMREPAEGWVLPSVLRGIMRVSALGYVETVFTTVYLPDDPVAMVVNAIADFIVRAGTRLRVCANRECRVLFIASKRQAYHDPACSQAERTQRKRDRMRPVSTEEKLWYTRQQRA